MPNLSAEAIEPLSRQEARHTERLLAECDHNHVAGLVHLLRFGVHSTGELSGAYAVAAWLLNAARFQKLPRSERLSRRDGTGFRHCDADWLAEQVLRGSSLQPDATVTDGETSLRLEFLRALKAVGAQGRHLNLTGLDADEVSKHLASELERNRPSVLIVSTSAGITLMVVLALHTNRQQLFCCDVADGRARLRWAGLEVLVKRVAEPGASLELVSVPVDVQSKAAADEVSYRGTQVVYLDSDQGRLLLTECEGLSVVAYAALHGNTQRDLSSCQVASLSSLAFQKGTRSKVAEIAAAALGERTAAPSLDTQALLRTLAAQQLNQDKGLEFAFRGLSVDELGRLAQSVGLHARAVELFEGAGKVPEAVASFRATARAALGRTIVNFSRSHLEQNDGGHHAVVVAYCPSQDFFLVDDPAGFKLPPFWVKTERLVRAMATFDKSPGVERFRGYLVVDSDASPEERELSMSLVLQKRRPSS